MTCYAPALPAFQTTQGRGRSQSPTPSGGEKVAPEAVLPVWIEIGDSLGRQSCFHEDRKPLSPGQGRASIDRGQTPVCIYRNKGILVQHLYGSAAVPGYDTEGRFLNFSPRSSVSNVLGFIAWHSPISPGAGCKGNLWVRQACPERIRLSLPVQVKIRLSTSLPPQKYPESARRVFV